MSRSLSSSFICVLYENKMPCVETASLFLSTCDPVSATKPFVTFLLNFVKTGMSSMNVSSVTVILFVGTESEFPCIWYFATSLGKIRYRTCACNTIGVLQVLWKSVKFCHTLYNFYLIGIKSSKKLGGVHRNL